MHESKAAFVPYSVYVKWDFVWRLMTLDRTSSFLYLKNLPVDELKIDRGFIHELTVGSKDEMILESIVHLAIHLGLVVTAEGVESPLQMEILSRLGCQQLQGYLLGMPMDVKRLEEFEYTSSTYFN